MTRRHSPPQAAWLGALLSRLAYLPLDSRPMGIVQVHFSPVRKYGWLSRHFVLRNDMRRGEFRRPCSWGCDGLHCRTIRLEYLLHDWCEPGAAGSWHDTDLLLAAFDQHSFVAFRGTSEAADFLTDVQDFEPANRSSLFPGIAGRLHRGIARAYMRVRGGLLTRLHTGCEARWAGIARRVSEHRLTLREVLVETANELLSAERRGILYLVGHSLGGGLATLLALDLAFNFATRLDGLHLLTYGAPPIADREFVHSITSSAPRVRDLLSRHERHVGVTRSSPPQYDIVTSLHPPMLRSRQGDKAAAHFVSATLCDAGENATRWSAHSLWRYIEATSRLRGVREGAGPRSSSDSSKMSVALPDEVSTRFVCPPGLGMETCREPFDTVTSDAELSDRDGSSDHSLTQIDDLLACEWAPFMDVHPSEAERCRARYAHTLSQ